MSVSVRIDGASLVVAAPYVREAVPELRALGGRWEPSSKTWRVPTRYEERLRALLREHYGTDGSPVELVAVRVRLGSRARAALMLGGLSGAQWRDLPNADRAALLERVDRELPLLSAEGEQEVSLFGRSIAWRPGRDSPVKLGEGVALVEGPPLPSTGGSVKNPRLEIDRPRVFEVCDVPRPLAERVIAAGGGAVWLAPPPATQADVRRAALLREREELSARLDAVDAELSALAGA